MLTNITIVAEDLEDQDYDGFSSYFGWHGHLYIPRYTQNGVINHSKYCWCNDDVSDYRMAPPTGFYLFHPMSCGELMQVILIWQKTRFVDLSLQ